MEPIHTEAGGEDVRGHGESRPRRLARVDKAGHMTIVRCEECPKKDAEIRKLQLSEARARDDCRRASEAWLALKKRHANKTETFSEPAQHIEAPKRQVIQEYEVADFPYPREWELEDLLLKEENEELKAQVKALRGEISKSMLDVIDGKAVLRDSQPLTQYHNNCRVCGGLFWTPDAQASVCKECTDKGAK